MPEGINPHIFTIKLTTEIQNSRKSLKSRTDLHSKKQYRQWQEPKINVELFQRGMYLMKFMEKLDQDVFLSLTNGDDE